MQAKTTFWLTSSGVTLVRLLQRFMHRIHTPFEATPRGCACPVARCLSREKSHSVRPAAGLGEAGAGITDFPGRSSSLRPAWLASCKAPPASGSPQPGCCCLSKQGARRSRFGVFRRLCSPAPGSKGPEHGPLSTAQAHYPQPLGPPLSRQLELLPKPRLQPLLSSPGGRVALSTRKSSSLHTRLQLPGG